MTAPAVGQMASQGSALVRICIPRTVANDVFVILDRLLPSQAVVNTIAHPGALARSIAAEWRIACQMVVARAAPAPPVPVPPSAGMPGPTEHVAASRDDDATFLGASSSLLR